MQAKRECLVFMGEGQAEVTIPSGVWVFLSDELRQAGFQVDEYSPEPEFEDGKSKPVAWTGTILYDNEPSFIRQLAITCRNLNVSIRRI